MSSEYPCRSGDVFVRRRRPRLPDVRDLRPARKHRFLHARHPRHQGLGHAPAKLPTARELVDRESRHRPRRRLQPRSDADTLWSAEDYSSSSFDGAASIRPAGMPVRPGPVSTCQSCRHSPWDPGPVGATERSQAGGLRRADLPGRVKRPRSAVEVSPISDPWSPTVWFYRTSERGPIMDPGQEGGSRRRVCQRSSRDGRPRVGDHRDEHRHRPDDERRLRGELTDVPGSGLPDDGKISPMFDWVRLSTGSGSRRRPRSIRTRSCNGAPLIAGPSDGRPGRGNPANFPATPRAKVGPRSGTGPPRRPQEGGSMSLRRWHGPIPRHRLQQGNLQACPGSS